MNTKDIVNYYNREELQDFFVSFSKNREVVGMYRNKSFAKRPNTIIYPKDIISQVRSGIIEFHSSIELWENPMTLKNRKGFDVIFDLDCKRFEHGKVAAIVLSKVLEKHGIKNYSVKFSGNNGFHLGIPWNSLPKEINFKPTASLFPEVARKVGLYLRDFMKTDFEKALLKNYSPEKLSEETGIGLDKILTDDGINPFQIVDIDPVLISPRHLFRMPYSLNMKTFLVSLPVNNVKDFEREHASPNKIKSFNSFLSLSQENEAELLFAEALDWSAKNVEKEKPFKKKFEIKEKVPEKYFPPCIKIIQNGIKDGRKRSLFILINFLNSLKWDWESIESFLLKWNKKNLPPLSEQYIVTQTRYYSKKKQFPPPNCKQEGWYLNFNVCHPDNVCSNIKNPVNYPVKLISNEPKPKKQRKRKKPKKKENL